MNRRRGFIRTVLVLLFLFACVSAALYVPQTVSGWYEEQALGQVSYEELSYEPYEIRYYESFEEKLDAIASKKEQGVETYTMRIGERTDNIKDEDLIGILDKELVKLHEAGLLPEEIHVRALMGRGFLELYEIQNQEPGEEDAARLRNIYLWELECTTEHGTILVRMDNEYYKIYSFSLYQEPHGEDADAWYAWWKPYARADRAAIAKGWIDYWELAGAKEHTELYGDTDVLPNSKTDGPEPWSGESTVWLYIETKSGHTLIRSANFYGYYEKGWGISWDLFDL